MDRREEDLQDAVNEALEMAREIADWNGQTVADVLREAVGLAYESMLDWKAPEGVPLEETAAGREGEEMAKAFKEKGVL